MLRAWRYRAWRRGAAAIRSVLVLLALLVAAGPSAPVFARMLGGPPAHACHCDTRGGHAHCACPICFPELATLDAPSGDPIATGICGDDDPAWRTLAMPIVATSGFTLLVDERCVVASPPVEDTPAQWSRAPDPRPPRTHVG